MPPNADYLHVLDRFGRPVERETVRDLGRKAAGRAAHQRARLQFAVARLFVLHRCIAPLDVVDTTSTQRGLVIPIRDRRRDLERRNQTVRALRAARGSTDRAGANLKEAPRAQAHVRRDPAPLDMPAGRSVPAVDRLGRWAPRSREEPRSYSSRHRIRVLASIERTSATDGERAHTCASPERRALQTCEVSASIRRCGHINAPVGDRAAARASGWFRRAPALSEPKTHTKCRRCRLRPVRTRAPGHS